MRKNLKKALVMVLTLAIVCMPMAVLAEGDVASVDGTGYTSLQAAINDADGKVVTLLSNVTESITIPQGIAVALDLGSFTLTNTAGKHTITNKGSLTITGDGIVDNVSHGRGALVNNGTAKLQSGTLKRSGEASTSATNNGGNSWYVVDNNGGTMTVSGGKIINTSKYSSLIRNLNAKFYMKGGKLENDFITLKNDDNGIIEMTGGTVSTNGSGGSAIQNWGDLTMTGGTLNAASDAVAIYALRWKEQYTSTATVSGDAKINGDIRINIDSNYPSSPSPEMEIKGGSVSGDIKVNTNSKLTINGGNFGGAITSKDGTGDIAVNGGTYAVKPDDEYINADSTVAKYSTENKDAYYIGTSERIGEKLSNADAGDKIEIIQGNVEIIVPDGVTISNSGTGSVLVNGDAVEQNTTIVTHTHDAVKVEAKEPTITKPGNIEYWYCEGCDKYFSNAELTEEITLDKTVIAATGEPEPSESIKPEPSEEPTAKPSAEPTTMPSAVTTQTQAPVSESAQTSESTQNSTPKTGDNGNMTLWIMLTVVAAAALAGLILVYVKKRRAE